MTPQYSSQQIDDPPHRTKTPPRRPRRVLTKEGVAMQSSPSVVQLVTRIPYELRHRAKVHCVQHDTTLTQFVIDAIRERLESKQQTEREHRTRR